MKKIFHCMTTAAAIFSSAMSQSAIVGATGNITRIGTGWAGEALYVSLNQPYTTPCPNPNMAAIGTSAPQYKETTSIVLTAYAQGKSVTIYYDNSSCPRGDVPAIVGVAVN